MDEKRRHKKRKLNEISQSESSDLSAVVHDAENSSLLMNQSKDRIGGPQLKDASKEDTGIINFAKK
jgi:hypothetical protein